jgi:hypothetical protein
MGAVFIKIVLDTGELWARGLVHARTERVREGEHRTSNIERRTSKWGSAPDRWMLGVRCWLLDVFRFWFSLYKRILSAQHRPDFMAKGGNKNTVSVWFWMFAIFVMALPCIGMIMIVVWAFVGENESRKNFFKAMLLWYLIIAVVWAVLFVIGFWPEIYEGIRNWLLHILERPSPKHV